MPYRDRMATDRMSTAGKIVIAMATVTLLLLPVTGNLVQAALWGFTLVAAALFLAAGALNLLVRLRRRSR